MSGKMSLRQSLERVISAQGPISIATYMQQSLVHSQEGYYVTRDPLGQRGDFITSPEISQMFGELIGINLMTQWMAHNKPPKIRIAELGPGRGTLMSDLLRTAQVFKPFYNSIHHIDLVEASPTLKEKQSESIGAHLQSHVNLRWHDATRELPQDGVPTFIVAHEFFDALPIHQFEKGPDHKWLERLVDYDPETSQFRFTISTKQKQLNKHLSAAISAQPRFKSLPPSSSIEVCPEAWSVTEQLSSILKVNGGGALIVDYGPMATIPVNTFRGFKAHHQIDPLSVDPGDADLTADVDFRALADIFVKNKLNVSGPVSQANWLHRMGIGARATVLANHQSTDEGKERIASAYRRLVDPANMGKTYKVMGVSSLNKQIEGFQ